jgi:hypothetical protein
MKCGGNRVLAYFGCTSSTWTINLVLSIMATPVAMEVLSLHTTFENEPENPWRKWLSTTPLLSNKSTSEVLFFDL